MALENIVNGRKSKEIVKLITSLATGVGLAYISSKTGVTDWLCETQSERNGLLGDWYKNLSKTIYDNGGKYLVHIGIGALGFLPTYLILNRRNK